MKKPRKQKELKEILLTQGKVALVDADDYEKLSQYKWHAQKDYKSKNCYYARHKKEGILMHHLVIGRPPMGMMTDHIDGNGLNNQKHNLHHVTNRVNQQKRVQCKSSSFPGIHWCKRASRWISRIKINGKSKYLGTFNNELDAFNAYKNAVNALTEDRL